MAKDKIVVTLGGLSLRKTKKASKKMVKRVMKDKTYRRTVKEAGGLSRKASKQVARAAVHTVFKHHKEIEERPSLARLWTEAAARTVSDRKAAERTAKKREKQRDRELIKKWKKRGGKYIPKKGLVKLLKAEKLPKMKKGKYNKPWKAK